MSFVDPKSYAGSELKEEDVAADPIEQFRRWWHEALAAQLSQPEAMTLATCSVDGKPSARMVLLRGFDERGFTFFTNYHSRKGQELIDNPRAALVLFWEPLDRQVRIEGWVEKTSAEESDDYFQQRPRGSQLGAWASPQSQVLSGREELQHRVEEIVAQYGERPVPRPPHWGGFRVVPERIEFWQGRPSRLHDRLCFRRDEHGRWILERLAP